MNNWQFVRDKVVLTRYWSHSNDRKAIINALERGQPLPVLTTTPLCTDSIDTHLPPRNVSWWGATYETQDKKRTPLYCNKVTTQLCITLQPVVEEIVEEEKDESLSIRKSVLSHITNDDGTTSLTIGSYYYIGGLREQLQAWEEGQSALVRTQEKEAALDDLISASKSSKKRRRLDDEEDDHDSGRNVIGKCPLCLYKICDDTTVDALRVAKLPCCQHLIHIDCLHAHLDRTDVCLLCRQSLLDYAGACSPFFRTVNENSAVFTSTELADDTDDQKEQDYLTEEDQRLLLERQRELQELSELAALHHIAEEEMDISDSFFIEDEENEDGGGDEATPVEEADVVVATPVATANALPVPVGSTVEVTTRPHTACDAGECEGGECEYVPLQQSAVVVVEATKTLDQAVRTTRSFIGDGTMRISFCPDLPVLARVAETLECSECAEKEVIESFTPFVCPFAEVDPIPHNGKLTFSVDCALCGRISTVDAGAPLICPLCTATGYLFLDACQQCQRRVSPPSIEASCATCGPSQPLVADQCQICQSFDKVHTTSCQQGQWQVHIQYDDPLDQCMNASYTLPFCYHGNILLTRLVVAFVRRKMFCRGSGRDEMRDRLVPVLNQQKPLTVDVLAGLSCEVEQVLRCYGLDNHQEMSLWESLLHLPETE